MLPDWLDVDALRAITAATVFVCAAAAVVVLVRVRQAATKVIGVLLLVGLAGGIFYYRETLDECAKTCSCKLINDHIPSSGCAVVPAEDEAEDEREDE